MIYDLSYPNICNVKLGRFEYGNCPGDSAQSSSASMIPLRSEAIQRLERQRQVEPVTSINHHVH
jgi:hypothetical protein